MVTVQLTAVSRIYPGGKTAVTDLDLTVNSREYLVLVGPSGCGKTTTLRLIAGLDQPTKGTIRIGDRLVNLVPPWEREVAMVFQRPALYPTRTVRDNLFLGMAFRKRMNWFPRWLSWSREEVECIQEAANLLNLGSLLDRFPRELSGGEQQRVALGRVLVRRPRVLLLDEPLGHLDWRMRQDLIGQLPLLRERLAATIIHVTHDPEEAVSLADRVAFLHGGKLQQIASLEEMRRSPANALVREFLEPFSHLKRESRV